MFTFRSREVATSLFFALLSAVGCASDGDANGTGGTAGIGASGGERATAGAAGDQVAAAGAAGDGVGAGSDDVAGGDSGASDQSGGNGGTSDLPPGAGGTTNASLRYPCEGPNAEANQAGDGGAGAALSCVVGQNFCFVLAGLPANPGGNTVYVPECRSFSESGVDKCAKTPTCDCLCTRFACNVECRCNEVDGFATMTCHQI